MHIMHQPYQHIFKEVFDLPQCRILPHTCGENTFSFCGRVTNNKHKTSS